MGKNPSHYDCCGMKVINISSSEKFMFSLWVRIFVFVLLYLSPSRGENRDFENPSPPSPNLARNASREAYQHFRLVHIGEEEDVNIPHDPLNVVFVDGKVNPNWIPLSEAESRDPSRLNTLFQHDEYTDRISFEYSYGSFLHYDIRSPVVSAVNEDVAKPKVIDFQMDHDDQFGAFTIVYDCHRHPINNKLRNTTISVIFPVVNGLSLYFSFRKSCGGGIHKFVELGYFEESSHAAIEVSRVPFFSSKLGPVFGPHVMSTKIYIHLFHPAMSQEFFHVNISSATPSLVIHNRGPTFGGILKASETAVLHFLYECQGNGEVEVSLSIPIFPFHALSAHWTKDCGGGEARGLNVGTSMLERKDVVIGGETQDIWKLALQTTSASISTNAPRLNSSTRVKDYWLFNDGIPIHVALAIVTVENPEVLVPVLSYPETKLSAAMKNIGGILPNGELVHIRIRMICKRKGTSLIIVTIPVKSFSNVEFGFLKECRAPRRHIRTGFLRTANSVMTVSTFLLAGTFAYWWVWQLRIVRTSENSKSSTKFRQQL